MEHMTETVVWRTRVRYAETDQMGVAHHATYAIWFEASRSEFCRLRGIDYPQIERDGMLLPILEIRVRYLQPAFYEDELEVRTRVGGDKTQPAAYPVRSLARRDQTRRRRDPSDARRQSHLQTDPLPPDIAALFLKKLEI